MPHLKIVKCGQIRKLWLKNKDGCHTGGKENSMSILFFDTETTGLPPRGSAFAVVNGSNYTAWRSCRIVQIAWEIRSAMDHAVLAQRSFIVQPSGFSIPDEATRIHGIDTARAKSEGQPLARVIAALLADIKMYDVHTCVAHNMAFDDNVLMAELYTMAWTEPKSPDSDSMFMTQAINTWRGLHKQCTMRMGAALQPGGRWPKLSALYEKLFGVEPTGQLHSADTDTRLCAEIYLKLIEPGKKIDKQE